MIVAADLETLDYAYGAVPLVATAPANVDTLTLDFAFGAVPFVAYVEGLVAQQPRIWVST